MTTFDERENAFEQKYAHDQELAFRIAARCAKLLGLWAASQMNLEGKEAEAYAESLVHAGVDKPGIAHMKIRVLADFVKKSVSVSEHMVDRHIENFLREAENLVVKGRNRG